MNDICPLCNCKKFSVIGKPRINDIAKEIVRWDYKVVQCKNCTVYFVSPKIDFSSEEWGKLYNSEYFPEKTEWLNKKRKKEITSRFDTAIKYMDTKGEKKLLDIGTGEGKTLLEGLNRRWNVSAIDIVDNRIIDAKIEKVNFIKAHFLEHDFKNEKFDLIYLDSVLEHVLTPKEYLQKAKTLLKPGGIIYIGIPNENSLFNELRKILFSISGKKNISAKINPFDSPYHIIGFNRKALNYLTDDLSLKVHLFRNFGRKMAFLMDKPGTHEFWVDLFFLFPVELLGKAIGKDVYFELYLSN